MDSVWDQLPSDAINNYIFELIQYHDKPDSELRAFPIGIKSFPLTTKIYEGKIIERFTELYETKEVIYGYDGEFIADKNGIDYTLTSYYRRKKNGPYVHKQECHNSETRHYVDDVLHNTNGPALIFDRFLLNILAMPRYSEAWFINGKMSANRKGFHEIRYYRCGNIFSTMRYDPAVPGRAIIKQYHKDNRLKKIIYCKVSFDGIKYNIVRHRKNGPAYTSYSSSGVLLLREWYRDGKLFREDGPAHIYYSQTGKIRHQW